MSSITPPNLYRACQGPIILTFGEKLLRFSFVQSVVPEKSQNDAGFMHKHRRALFSRNCSSPRLHYWGRACLKLMPVDACLYSGLDRG